MWHSSNPTHLPDFPSSRFTTSKTVYNPTKENLKTVATDEELLLIFSLDDITAEDTVTVTMEESPFTVIIIVSSNSTTGYSERKFSYTISLLKELVRTEGISYKRTEQGLKVIIPQHNFGRKKTSFSVPESF